MRRSLSERERRKEYSWKREKLVQRLEGGGKLALWRNREECRVAGVSVGGEEPAEAWPWMALEVSLRGLNFILRARVGEI